MAKTPFKSVLVVDVGTEIIGIYDVEARKYTPYKGASRNAAIAKIQQAPRVVTYNGNRYDLVELAKLAGQTTGPLQLSGAHDDMQVICWPGIRGSSLSSTYERLLGDCPTYPATYQGNNECDVYMTFKLWDLWRTGKLTDINGQPILPEPF